MPANLACIDGMPRLGVVLISAVLVSAWTADKVQAIPIAASAATAVAQSDAPILSAAPGHSVTYEIGDALNMAYVERDRMSSVDLLLRLQGVRFQGRIGRQQVEMTMEGSRIDGKIGERPIALSAERTGAQLHIDGMFGSRTISLTVDPRSLRGQVGPCQYELALQRRAYAGRVFCGSGAPLRMRLKIPVSLAAKGDVELSALLAALLVR